VRSGIMEHLVDAAGPDYWRPDWLDIKIRPGRPKPTTPGSTARSEAMWLLAKIPFTLTTDRRVHMKA